LPIVCEKSYRKILQKSHKNFAIFDSQVKKNFLLCAFFKFHFRRLKLV